MPFLILPASCPLAPGMCFIISFFPSLVFSFVSQSQLKQWYMILPALCPLAPVCCIINARNLCVALKDYHLSFTYRTSTTSLLCRAFLDYIHSTRWHRIAVDIQPIRFWTALASRPGSFPIGKFRTWLCTVQWQPWPPSDTPHIKLLQALLWSWPRSI
jgi:hypothetical protein